MSSKDFFGKNTKEWKWEDFKSTEGFPISENLLDWVIGQENAMNECKLCLDEWIKKLKDLDKKKWWKFWESPDSEKPSIKEYLPAGPFLLLLGDAGTGKSLLGRALANHLTPLYKKFGVTLVDIVCWMNKLIPSEPKISIHKSGEGKRKVRIEKIKVGKKQRLKNWLIKGVTGFLAGVASVFLTAGFYFLYDKLMTWNLNPLNMWGVALQDTYNGNLIAYMLEAFVSIGTMTFLPAGMMLLFMIFILLIGRMGMMGNNKGTGGAEQTEAPKLIVDNSQSTAPFIDATGHGSSQLFGSIAWDPLQTGGLGTPEHQRVSAGDVHRAHMGILYIDEIKNLSGLEAVTLLTVLEEGQLPITMRSHGSVSGDTAAMAVATEPVPAMAFLVAAGNFDSIPQIHPALMDRIYGYGKVVRMNNEMPNTKKNRQKYVQFIAQEIKRFNLIPFTREACERIIVEGRRKSGFNDKLTTKFRPMISVIKTAAILAINEKKQYVEGKHVQEAIEDHCKTIHRQLLEYWVNRGRPFIYINPKAEPRTGQIAGLAVRSFANDHVGEVGILKASMLKVAKARIGKTEPYFHVTGVAKPDKSQWIHDSIVKVRHVIIEKYGIDPAIDYKTIIDFQQESGVDGPSAGITMTLALMSILDKKKIRQNIAVTGEITIDSEGKYIITPIGGVDAKIKAAQYWGYEKVVIPMRNFKKSINPKDYTIKVVGCETLEDYMGELFVEEED